MKSVLEINKHIVLLFLQIYLNTFTWIKYQIVKDKQLAMAKKEPKPWLPFTWCPKASYFNNKLIPVDQMLIFKPL